jgi:hypothetical protein
MNINHTRTARIAAVVAGIAGATALFMSPAEARRGRGADDSVPNTTANSVPNTTANSVPNTTANSVPNSTVNTIDDHGRRGRGGRGGRSGSSGRR